MLDKEGDMLNINITNFRKNIFSILEQTIKFNEPVNVSTKDGNAVMLSEEDYNGLTGDTRYFLCVSYKRINHRVLECSA